MDLDTKHTSEQQPSSSESVWSAALAITPFLVVYAQFLVALLDNRLFPNEAVALRIVMIVGTVLCLYTTAQAIKKQEITVSLATIAPFLWTLLTMVWAALASWYTFSTLATVVLAVDLDIRVLRVAWWKMAALTGGAFAISVGVIYGTSSYAHIPLSLISDLLWEPLYFTPLAILAVGSLRAVGRRRGSSIASAFLLSMYVLGLQSGVGHRLSEPFCGRRFDPPTTEEGLMLVAAMGTIWLAYRSGKEWQKRTALVLGAAAVGYFTPSYSLVFSGAAEHIDHNLVPYVQAATLVFWVVVSPLLRLPGRQRVQT